MNRILASAAILFGSNLCLAQYVVYYTTDPKRVEVSGTENTLLSFPAPPYAFSCHPSSVVELVPVASLTELDDLRLKQQANYQSSEDSKTQPKSDAELSASLLRLIPTEGEKETSCAIRLANGDVANLNFFTNVRIATPAIEFKSVYERPQADVALIKNQGALNLFRELLKGGNITALTEITPTLGTTKDTGAVVYKVAYVGSDGENFTGWRLTAEVKAESFTAPRRLTKAKMGQLYFSGVRRMTRGESLDFKQGEGFYLYILGKRDLSLAEVMELL